MFVKVIIVTLITRQTGIIISWKEAIRKTIESDSSAHEMVIYNNHVLIPAY